MNEIMHKKVSPPLKLLFVHKGHISFFNKFVEKSMGSFVVAIPRKLGIAATQDDKAMCVKWGRKEAARFVLYKTRRFLPQITPTEHCHPE